MPMGERFTVSRVPQSGIGDHFAEFVCILGLIAGTCGKVGREIYTLMKTEYGELGTHSDGRSAEHAEKTSTDFTD